MSKNTGINRKWVNYIDLNLMDIYPIQFANCDRLHENDAVYIFDEVGSGKTISSGLMALDYLCNYKDKVLIITTNALTKKGSSSEYGQFLKDWYDKLPFRQLELTDRIDIVNNHYSNLISKGKYGLVIVDEAQLFLNKDSLRYQHLIEDVRAEKIVFLTATPIKISKNDLYTYVELARSITEKDISDTWIDEINTNNKTPEEIVCSRFDINSPVTRYFKDTIMSLNVEGYQKNQARRLTPQLWKYGVDTSKTGILLKEINEKYERNSNNRFVIFTKLVEKEANIIEEYLINNGFIPYDKTRSNKDKKTIKVITGANGYELSDYSSTFNLPTVLILTYQIAEQGVNLPGYNHVINYHVSAFPSALEQRFGRIDRMGKNGSCFSEINMCFLISNDYWDTNTWNFYCAITIYLRNLISYLPSKNTILSEEIIQKYCEAKRFVKDYIERITMLINQERQINYIVDYFNEKNSDDIDILEIECKCDTELFEFIDENAIEFDISIDRGTAIKSFREEVKTILAEYNRGFNSKDDFSSERYETIIKSVSDKVFYSSDESFVNIQMIDAISDCGKKIAEQESFMQYTNKFKHRVKLPIIVNNYMDKMNRFFEKKFIDNEFNSIFSYNGYRDIFEEILCDIVISMEDKKLILDNCNVIVSILPIFKMFKIYEEILQHMVYTQNDDVMVRFDINPFKTSFFRTYNKVRKDVRHIGLSDDFFDLYFNNTDAIKELYKISVVDNVAQASNWYKLTYHYTRKEEACFINKKCLYKHDNKNFYYQKENLIKFLAMNYKSYLTAAEERDKQCFEYNSAYKVAMDREDSCFNPDDLLHKMGYYGEPEQPDIISEYKIKETQLREVLQRIDKEKTCHKSLFNHFIFTKGGKYREHSLEIYTNKELKVYCNDLWTQGIFYEVSELTYINCTLEKVATLPPQFRDICLY